VETFNAGLMVVKNFVVKNDNLRFLVRISGLEDLRFGIESRNRHDVTFLTLRRSRLEGNPGCYRENGRCSDQELKVHGFIYS